MGCTLQVKEAEAKRAAEERAAIRAKSRSRSRSRGRKGSGMYTAKKDGRDSEEDEDERGVGGLGSRPTTAPGFALLSKSMTKRAEAIIADIRCVCVCGKGGGEQTWRSYGCLSDVRVAGAVVVSDPTFEC